VRLDKFLKVSRLVKRRTVANQVADAGQVWVNGKLAKPSYHVKPGDDILLVFGERSRMQVKVVLVPLTKNVPADMASSLYDVVTEEMP
jgi:ribosomal 50S subunit-recycling heat shock protein